MNNIEKSKVKKAIIPAAGYGTRFLPITKAIPKEMFPIIDKPTIQYIVQEAIDSGIEEILIIVSSNKHSVMNYFDSNLELENLLLQKNKLKEYEQITKIANNIKIFFHFQKEQLGLGDAILQGETFINNEPFAILLGDDIVINKENELPALKQCINAFNEVKKSVLGVQEVNLNDVNKYGIIDPISIDNKNKLFKLKGVVEKPNIDEAPSQFAILGRYILTPKIFTYLKNLEKDKFNEIELTDAILKLSKNDDVYAYDFNGTRFDIGSKIGYIKAILYLAINSKTYKNEVLDFINQINNK